MPNLLAGLALLCAVTGAEAAQSCKASYYGAGEKLARHTANGEVFRPSALTAAMRSRAFGRKIRVTYRGKSVVVRHNDWGPHPRTGRCIDLSRAAAAELGMLRVGVATVNIEVLK